MEKDDDIKPDARRKYARSEETRARILAAALEESAHVGFHKASMANIAARAEVAVGILNYHFGSRQEMLRELMSTQIQHFWSMLSLPQAELKFFEYEAAILKVYLEFLHANPNYVQLAEEIRRYEPELYERGSGIQLEYITRRLETGVDRGELQSMAADEIRTRAYLILGAYTFLDRLVEGDNYPGDEFVITIVMNTLRNGLAPDSTDFVAPNSKAQTD
jgi:AcrR family transcriptional regulator|tara:strand:- start:1002 stop:1658 length:657 start_codon:yes stop_codon:yes gene_type:complete